MPLVAAAAAVTACALASLAQPVLGASLGAVLSAPAFALALTSHDRARRILWCAVAVSALLAGARALVVAPPIFIAADPRVLALREALALPIRGLVPEPEGGIVLGIVLGERASIPRDLVNAFAVTGTAHLLAISGSNMTLVAGAVAFALRHRAAPAVVAVATVAAVVAYSVLVGLGASVIRAALMATVTSLGLALGRGNAAANALGAAVVAMLVADPRNATDVGFQLSVAATGGLIAWQRPLAERLSRVPRVLGEALSATLAASIPTIPIAAAVFGRISLISPAANLVAVPLFAPVMLFGASTAVMGVLLPAAAGPLAMAAYASAWALRRVVEAGALIPGAAVAVPAGLLTGIAVTAALALGWVALRTWGGPIARIAVARPIPIRPRVSARSWVIAGTAAFAVAVVAGSAAAAGLLSRGIGFRLHALDIGQGDAFLLESDGRYALIDGGPDPALLLRRLGEVLPPWQRRIDVVALTHEHADHGAGLLAALDRYDVGLAIEPAGMNDVPLVRFWSEHLAQAHVRRQAVSEGATIRIGRAALRVLAPGRDRRVDVPSLVLRADDGQTSILFMGDAVDDAIADLLLAPQALASRVYVPPHHGADSTHAGALVAAVRPDVSVISVGANNKYGHPAPSTLAALGSLPVYRTDRYGTVEIELDGPLLVRTAKTPLPPDRGGSVPGAPAAR
jgi:competence protein ComEC